MEDPPQGVYNHEALYYIAKSIDVIGKVDAVYFAYDWQTARGCRIERKICQEYGIKILEYDFLDEIKNEYCSTTRLNDNIQFPYQLTRSSEEKIEPYKITCDVPKGEMPY